MKIVGLADKAGNAKPVVGIGDDLAVKIDGTAALDPTVYVLFIDGRPLQGLDALFDEKAHALIFILRHSDTNASSWKALLGAPTGLTIPITISLGIKTAQGTPTPSIFGDGKNDRTRSHPRSGLAYHRCGTGVNRSDWNRVGRRTAHHLA